MNLCYFEHILKQRREICLCFIFLVLSCIILLIIGEILKFNYSSRNVVFIREVWILLIIGEIFKIKF